MKKKIFLILFLGGILILGICFAQETIERGGRDNEVSGGGTYLDKGDLTMVGDAIHPASLSDTTAPNNSIYYSTTQSALVYKDSAGVVHPLY